MLEQFSTIDKGWSAFVRINTAKKEAYFRFEDSYFELLSDRNRWQEPEHKMGIGWVTNQSRLQEKIHGLLQQTYGAAALSVYQQDEFHTLYVAREDTLQSVMLDVWAYAYEPQFMRKIYGEQPRARRCDRQVVSQKNL